MGAAPRRRALVIGGSIGGLFAAIRLQQAGWDVEVFERSDVELGGRGAGIVTQPQLRTALAAVGGGEARAVDVSRRRVLDRAGRVVVEAVRDQVATSWDGVFGVLRAAFPGARYHLDRTLTGLDVGDDGVTARFADGTAAEAELLVGADGFRSAVRSLTQPEVRPLYAGYVAWRGLVEEAAFPPALHRDLFDYFAFGLPPREQILGYPVAGANNDVRPGRRRYNFVWYRPAEASSELPRLLTDEAGRTHEMSIPPPLIARDAVAEMRAHAGAVFAPQFADLVALTAQPFVQPIYDLEAPRLVTGRTALIGDAAFVARPHVGAGTAKAIDDAATLARCLGPETGTDAGLARFEGERLAVGRRVVAQARRLGGYMTEDAAATPWSPEAILAETALLDFLDA